jgi:class 3 adenylate cyclase
VSGKRFGEVFRKYDEIVLRGEAILGTQSSGHLSSSSRSQLKNKIRQLDAGGAADRLADFIERADDISVQQMRPYALADVWKLPRRAVLETFLRATRVGILDMYWDILCPMCRGVTDDVSDLKHLHGSSHCNACQMDFDASFDENIEVVFRPNVAIRKVDLQALYCTGNPHSQPDIVLNKLVVPAGEELSVGVALAAGRYHVSAMDLDGVQILSASENGAKEVEIRARENGLSGTSSAGLYPRLKLINETGRDQTFEIASADRVNQAATAADVTTLQVFRDLFSSEVFRPGEEISIGATTLMFTDLRGSTKLYREIGDATAFSRVREHFEILERVISAEGGSVVKTIGDAVMATFRSPGAAIRAIWDVQKELTARGEPLLLIKVGIHQGPCIAVNLNDRLDYFGSTVNITSRLPGFSSGGEVVFTRQVYDDPEVKRFLEGAHPAAQFSGEIRGYDEELDLWKVKMG